MVKITDFGLSQDFEQSGKDMVRTLTDLQEYSSLADDGMRYSHIRRPRGAAGNWI